MAVALAQIDAAFDEVAAVNGFKMRVEDLLRRGSHDRAVRARFAARAERLAGRPLDASIFMVERWWREERKAFQLASVFGRGARLPLDVLRELRLILRFMRFKRMSADYESVLAAFWDEPLAMAAE